MRRISRSSVVIQSENEQVSEANREIDVTIDLRPSSAISIATSAFGVLIEPENATD